MTYTGSAFRFFDNKKDETYFSIGYEKTYIGSGEFSFNEKMIYKKNNYGVDLIIID
jgi:hypothetical protein